jgi:hypothetical protein
MSLLETLNKCKKSFKDLISVSPKEYFIHFNKKIVLMKEILVLKIDKVFKKKLSKFPIIIPIFLILILNKITHLINKIIIIKNSKKNTSKILFKILKNIQKILKMKKCKFHFKMSLFHINKS